MLHFFTKVVKFAQIIKFYIINIFLYKNVKYILDKIIKIFCNIIFFFKNINNLTQKYYNFHTK